MTEAKKNSECPLCDGTGKVAAAVAASKIELRDRQAYNDRMRPINERARLRKKAAKKPKQKS